MKNFAQIWKTIQNGNIHYNIYHHVSEMAVPIKNDFHIWTHMKSSQTEYKMYGYEDIKGYYAQQYIERMGGEEKVKEMFDESKNYNAPFDKRWHSAYRNLPFTQDGFEEEWKTYLKFHFRWVYNHQYGNSKKKTTFPLTQQLELVWDVVYRTKKTFRRNSVKKVLDQFKPVDMSDEKEEMWEIWIDRWAGEDVEKPDDEAYLDLEKMWNNKIMRSCWFGKQYQIAGKDAAQYIERMGGYEKLQEKFAILMGWRKGKLDPSFVHRWSKINGCIVPFSVTILGMEFDDAIWKKFLCKHFPKIFEHQYGDDTPLDVTIPDYIERKCLGYFGFEEKVDSVMEAKEVVNKKRCSLVRKSLTKLCPTPDGSKCEEPIVDGEFHCEKHIMECPECKWVSPSGKVPNKGEPFVFLLSEKDLEVGTVGEKGVIVGKKGTVGEKGEKHHEASQFVDELDVEKCEVIGCENPSLSNTYSACISHYTCLMCGSKDETVALKKNYHTVLCKKCNDEVTLHQKTIEFYMTERFEEPSKAIDWAIYTVQNHGVHEKSILDAPIYKWDGKKFRAHNVQHALCKIMNSFKFHNGFSKIDSATFEEFSRRHLLFDVAYEFSENVENHEGKYVREDNIIYNISPRVSRREIGSDAELATSILLSFIGSTLEEEK